MLPKSMDWILYDNGLRHERVKFLQDFSRDHFSVGKLTVVELKDRRQTSHFASNIKRILTILTPRPPP